MNVNFGQNLASMALNNFMAMGNMMTQTANAMRSPGMQQFMNMGQNSFGVGGGFAFAAAGNFQTPGFLPQPMGGGANFAQMGQAMNGMAQPWNMMGNMLNGGMPGMMNMPNPQQIMGQMMGMMQNIANMMNQMAPQMQMMNQLNHAKQATAMGQMPGTVMPNQAPGTTKLPGTAPSFPGQAASDFISTLPNDKNGVAKALNVGGSKDVTRINQALGMLKTAKPKLSPANGEAPKAGLQLSAQDVQAIRAAKTPQEAKSIVMKAIGKKVGMNLENINMKDKKGIRNSKARDAVNKLLGTKVRNGTEKNSGSSLVLDSMAESIVKFAVVTSVLPRYKALVVLLGPPSALAVLWALSSKWVAWAWVWLSSLEWTTTGVVPPSTAWAWALVWLWVESAFGRFPVRFKPFPTPPPL